MKKNIIKETLLTVILLSMTNFSYADNSYTYQSYEKLPKKEKNVFMKNLLNDRFAQFRKEPETLKLFQVKDDCESVVHINEITANDVVAHYRVSCSNFKERWHVVLVKFKDGYSTISPCFLDKGKYQGKASCSAITLKAMNKKN